MCEHPDSTCSKDLEAILAKQACLSEESGGKAMEAHKVVPDVIDCTPNSILEVAYANNAVVNNGNVLTPTQVQDPPILTTWNADEFSYHTLVMVDPDAPSRKDPRHREWHHWLVVNIPGSKVGSGQVLSQYIGAGPPKGTGLHRYVLLVFKQQTKQNFKETKLTYCSGKGRGNFKIRDFAKKYCLGEPIAGNFFLAEWDNYVPKLYKQLQGK